MSKNKKLSLRPPHPTEHEVQSTFAEWWSYFCKFKGLDHRLGFAIPNGGMRNKAVAGKLKAEGVKKGVPDWLFAVPHHTFHGLFIEFKTYGGKVRDDQLELATLLRQQGYNVIIAWSVEEAIHATKVYFSQIPPCIE